MVGFTSKQIADKNSGENNSAVYATLAAKGGSSDRNVDVKFFIHEYPDVI